MMLKNAEQYLQDLKQQKISSYDLTKQCIERIQALNPELNAIIAYDFEQALVAAKQADEKIQNGEWLPLLGLPMTVKESFHTKDFPTTWGNPAFKDFFAKEDALAIQRLKQAGAIIIGKSNVPFMLQDWQTNNPIYGLTKNPWDNERTCGGSSGGSAVALATGMVPLELGSDLAGSLRVPASFCGVYAHRPSSNIIPLRGSEPPGKPLAPGREMTFPVSGPMARSANDLKILLDVLAKPDPLWQGRGYSLNLPACHKTQLKDFNILVINQHPLCPLSRAVDAAFNHVIHFLKQQDASITYYDDTMPSLAAITQAYVSLMTSYGSAGLPDDEYQKLCDIANQINPADTSLQSCVLRGLTMTRRDHVRLEGKLEQLRGEFMQLFADYDVILTPVMPTSAFPHDFSDIQTRTIDIDGKQIPCSCLFSYVSIATAFGFPATAVPIQTNAEALPIGMQIIGNFLDDDTTIGFAELLEKNYCRFKQPK